MATIQEAAMTEKPMAMSPEPTYSGCCIQRYGPDMVTSRPFTRCPAAQMRSACPTRAIAVPVTSDVQVGVARMKATTATPNPVTTRRRAR